MVELSVLVLSLGPPIAQHLYTAWRRRKGKVDHQARSLKELIARDFENQLIRNKIERDLEGLSEHVIENLKPIFALDSSELSPNNLAVVVTALTDSVRAAGSSPTFLLERRLDPLVVAKAYREADPAIRGGLSSKQKSFFDACIEEIARCLTAIADQLPGFNTAFAQTVLENQGLILDQGKQIIRTLAEFSEANKTDASYLVDNFDSRFRYAVKHRFGEVYVLGLDPDTASPRLSLNTSYISLRAENVTRRKAPTASPGLDSDIPCDDILRYSPRLLIRGHAGSGKTTLLQWLATQCVDRGFLPPLQAFNDYAPLFVRLRDYYNQPLPMGPDLLATTSPALIALLPDDWFRDKMYRGRFLFLIDGLDEISEEQRGAVRAWLQNLILASPTSVYVVTTRPSAVEADYLKTVDFDEYFLKPMTPDEVSKFIDYWHDAVCESHRHDSEARALVDAKERQLRRSIEENRTLLRLASTPLLAAVICTLNFDGRLRVISDRIDLYRTACRLLYHDRHRMKEIKDQLYDALSQTQKERLLSELAYWFTKNGRTTCSMDDITKRLIAVHGGQGSDAQARKLAEAIVLRSGVLKEITPDSIQFLHKTFQEYLCAVAVVWHEDEMHVARHFDLRNWGELFLISVSLAPKRIANEMVAAVLVRSDEEQNSSAYILLAAASARESSGIAEELKQRISEKIKTLIPPEETRSAFELAQAGDLLLPFLEYQPTFSPTQVSRMVMLIGLLDNPDADRLLVHYAQQMEIDIDLVDSVMHALDYKADLKLSQTVIDVLKAKSSGLFWTAKRGGTLYVASNGLLAYTDFLPSGKCIVFDGRFGLDFNKALAVEWSAQEKINRLVIVEPEAFVTSRIDRFEGVRELVFVRAFLDDLDVCQVLRQLRTVVFIDTELAEWESLCYAELDCLYIDGVSTAKQVYHERIELRRYAESIYVSDGFVEAIADLEEKYGFGVDTWGFKKWQGRAFETLIRELTVDGRLLLRQEA